MGAAPAAGGPTQFSREMFPPGATSSPAPSSRSSRQDQLQEQRMAMMHLASKKKELEHNIANCPNEALRNRLRQELQGVQNDIKRLEGGGFFMKRKSFLLLKIQYLIALIECQCSHL